MPLYWHIPTVDIVSASCFINVEKTPAFVRMLRERDKRGLVGFFSFRCRYLVLPSICVDKRLLWINVIIFVGRNRTNVLYDIELSFGLIIWCVCSIHCSFIYLIYYLLNWSSGVRFSEQQFRTGYKIQEKSKWFKKYIYNILQKCIRCICDPTFYAFNLVDKS